ncbi:unnamed protein product [Arctogadus glacialis]
MTRERQRKAESERDEGHRWIRGDGRQTLKIVYLSLSPDLNQGLSSSLQASSPLLIWVPVGASETLNQSGGRVYATKASGWSRQ